MNKNLRACVDLAALQLLRGPQLTRGAAPGLLRLRQSFPFGPGGLARGQRWMSIKLNVDTLQLILLRLRSIEKTLR